MRSSTDSHFFTSAYVRNIGKSRYKYNVTFSLGASGTITAQNQLYEPRTFGVFLIAKM